MKRLKLLLLTVLAITATTAIAAAAANAESLPSVLWLTNGNLTSSGTQGTAGGGGTTVIGQFNGPLSITATYILVKLTATSTTGMADGGTAGVLFEGSKVKGTTATCHTSGDSATKGAVLIDNATWTIVLDLSGNAYVLVHIPEFELECPGNFPELIKIKGDVLNKVTPFGGGEHSTLTSETLCSAVGSTKAKWKEYDTHESTMASVALLANGGLGFSEVCEELPTATTNTLSTSAELMEP